MTYKRFRETSQRFPRRIAIRCKKDTGWLDLTYEKLRDNVESLAAFLSEEGISKGDRIAILLENRPEWPMIFFAAHLTGAIVVPVNPESQKKEVENILTDSECKMVFVSAKSFLLEEAARAKFPFIRRVISADSDIFREATKWFSGNLEYINAGIDDTACILYTSGTTDEPKGVMLSHKNFLSNAESLFSLNIITRKDSVVSILPLHHVYPLTGTLILPLIYGSCVIYPGSMRGEALIAAMQEANPSVFIAVPQVFYSFHAKITESLKKIPLPVNFLFRGLAGLLYRLRSVTGLNLSRFLFSSLHKKFGDSMRLFVSGGAKLDEAVERGLFKFGFTVLEGYGLTETSPVLTLNPLKKPKIGSAGRAIPGVELELIDKNDAGVGEVIARGPNIMKGYYKREDLTANVIKNGWFHTGDLGYLDREGYLFLTGRSKDTIVLSSGLNINPEEIEESYAKHIPAKEICVFEVPSKKGVKEANALWAVIVPDLEIFRRYGEVNLKSLFKERLDNVSKDLPPHKRLMGFTITLDPIPHTLLGKVKRFAVKEMYASAATDQEAPHIKELSGEDKKLMESAFGRKIISYLKKQTKVDRDIVPSDSLELDLGVDSLGRIEIASGLEKILGTKIKDEKIACTFTVRDVIRASIESVSSKEARVSGASNPELAVDSHYWRKMLDVPPKKESLDRIDLKPGVGAWLAGFLFTFFTWVIFKVLYSFKVEGAERLPRKGPYILYANHTSYFDPFLIAVSLPDFPRLDLFFVGFRVYLDVPVVRNLVKIGRLIPLDLTTHLLESLRSSFYVLRNGKSLCLFPEGMRTLDGNMGKFKEGFGILAKESKAKLVPVRIEGAFEAWPRTSKYPKRHSIKVRFGDALDVGQIEEEGLKMGAKESYEAICLAAREALVELKKSLNS